MNRFSLPLLSALLIGGLSLVLIATSGCNPADPNADIAGVNLQLDFRRTDLDLMNAAEALKGKDEKSYFDVYQQFLGGEKDFLFHVAGLDLINEELLGRGEAPIPPHMVDSVIAFRLGPVLTDSAYQSLLDTVIAVFPVSDPGIEAQLVPVLKRYHKHFPEVRIPKIRTHINGYDPSGHPMSVDQILATTDYLSIGLHYFMGADFPYYSPNLPGYIRRRFDKRYLASVVAHELAEGTVIQVSPQKRPTLLDKMIRAGIKLTVVSHLVPNDADSMVIFYKAREIEWANGFERDIYKDLSPSFFSTDFIKHRTYLSERPFTGEVAANSAPRLGEFIGWRIVQAYLKANPEVSLSQLVEMRDYENIFQQSRYKP